MLPAVCVCSNMTDDPTDWANLEAAKTLHEKTSEMAVALVINTMKLTENIEPASENEVKWQAYKLRSMINHLRRLRREAKSKDGRKTEKRSGLVALALQLSKIANTGVPAGKVSQKKTQQVAKRELSETKPDKPPALMKSEKAGDPNVPEGPLPRPKARPDFRRPLPPDQAASVPEHGRRRQPGQLRQSRPKHPRL